jgi:hypothetical protein
MAEAEDLDRGYLGSLLCLTLLAPHLIVAMLHGRQAPGLGLSCLLARVMETWEEQRVSFSAAFQSNDFSGGQTRWQSGWRRAPLAAVG